MEGARVVSVALASGAPVEAVFAGPGAPPDLLVQARNAHVPVHHLGPGVVERVADTVTPQPVMAVVGHVDRELEALSNASSVLVCIDVRDPGNAGTVMRSAEASGAGGVIFCNGSVDVYNPKTVRASAGSLFHIPVVAGGDEAEVLQRIGDWGLQRLGAVPAGGREYSAVDLTVPTAFVLGNEAAGLSPRAEALLDGRLTIPMAGSSESLNVGMAATVLCFEAARQRRVAAR